MIEWCIPIFKIFWRENSKFKNLFRERRISFHDKYNHHHAKKSTYYIQIMALNGRVFIIFKFWWENSNFKHKSIVDITNNTTYWQTTKCQLIIEYPDYKYKQFCCWFNEKINKNFTENIAYQLPKSVSLVNSFWTILCLANHFERNVAKCK